CARAATQCVSSVSNRGVHRGGVRLSQLLGGRARMASSTPGQHAERPDDEPKGGASYMLSFIREEEGQGLVEYALIIAVIAIAVIVAMLFLRAKSRKTPVRAQDPEVIDCTVHCIPRVASE